MQRVPEIMLSLAIIAAALALGGVEAAAYSVVEVGLFLALLLLVFKQTWEGKLQLPLAIWPVLFVVFVLLQTLPLPHRIVALLAPIRFETATAPGHDYGASTWITLSVDPHETVLALTKFLAYFGSFVLAAFYFDSRKGRSSLIRALILLGIFEAAHGIVQYITGWQKIFGYTKQNDLWDATGTYINRNHLAGLLELIIPLTLAMVFYSEDKRREGFANGRVDGSILGRRSVFYFFLAIIMGIGIIFSRSRGGILAMAFSVVLMLFVGRLAAWQKGWTVAVVLVFLCLVGYGLWIGLDPVLARFEQMGHRDYIRTEGRLTIWENTLELVHDYPLTGSGLGTFGTVFQRYQTSFVTNYVDHAHNDYLELIAETGVVGTLLLWVPILYLFLRMILSFLRDKRRYRRAVLLGCIGSTFALLIHSVTDFNLQIPANALVFAAVLGMGYKAAYVEPRAEGNGYKLPAA